ncbi:MAG: hypothetical protein LBP69_02260 [Treponema sp.]|jgi:hypothetical protein|nr:hypothetical protein [Treponema sp.]
MADQEGAFFTLNELLAVFPRLKHLEAVLKKDERAVLIKMEKVLYGHLSINEIEKRLKSPKEPETPAELFRMTNREALL